MTPDELVTTGAGRAPAPVLRVEHLTKTYGGVRALSDGSLRVYPGEVHGLIGENGSGKSTLLGIISGTTLAESGSVDVGAGAEPAAGTTSLEGVVAMVTQELSLAPDLTVAENIYLGHDRPRRWFGLDWPALRARAVLALDRFGLDVDPDARVSTLRIDQQQMVEILRAVERGAPVVVLDEPTSSLTEEGVQSLFAAMRRLRAEGIAIVFVSHRLEELFAITDRVTVLRDGRTVGSRPTHEYDRNTLVSEMLGHEPDDVEIPPASELGGAAVLEVAGLRAPGCLHGIDLQVRAGEVVGLVGLSGAGRSELLTALFGDLPAATGRVVVGGADTVPGDPREAMRRGLALVPGDRKLAGLALDMSLEDNLSVARHALRPRSRRVDRAGERRHSREQVAALGVVAATTAQTVGSLSGGNQQKVLLGRWLATDPTVLLLDEPTRGVDVMAKGEIHRLLLSAATAGAGVLISSSDVEELLALCHRFVVLFRGRVVAEVDGPTATESRLSHLAAGGAS